MGISPPSNHGIPDGGRGAYGWTITTLTPEAGTPKGGSKKSKNRSIKYVCRAFCHR
ncbi:MAG: hypothetical protein K2L82_04585 [Lachnospiraceae bacterium]|nr:hypothetical protein [Lachnospiraceae bacterium]